MTGARQAANSLRGGDAVSDTRTQDEAPPKPGPTPPSADRVRRAREALDAARARARDQNAARAQERMRDQELVERARAGDTRAFSSLVGHHQARLFAVAYGIVRDRDDAMDVVQDAFIKAHRKLLEFEGNSAFGTWLYRICVNLCIDRKRADARRRKTDLDDTLSAGLGDDASLYADSDITTRLSGSNPLRNLADRELGGQLDGALARLSEEHRSILLLREVEGMSYEEIAEALQIPRGTVMSRLFHARRNMQRLLRPVLGLEEGAGLAGARAVDDPARPVTPPVEEAGGSRRPSG